MFYLSQLTHFRFNLTHFKILLLIILLLSFFTSPFTISTKAAQGDNPLFPNFSFGYSTEEYDFGPNNAKVVAGPWILDGWKSWHSNWSKNFNGNKQIPYFHFYMIGGMARHDGGLQDCNVGAENTLCKQGANYIRNNQEAIGNNYIDVARQIGNEFGTKPVLIHMEPDFYQYHSDLEQQNPLSTEESWNLMNNWTAKIKEVLPSAVLVMDVSPWNSDLAGWSSGFQNFTYAGLVGKVFAADQAIDGKTYAQISALTGKKLIVNTAHVAGGAPAGFNYSWTPRQTIADRWNDGVVAVLESVVSQGDKDYYQKLIKDFTASPVPGNPETQTPSAPPSKPPVKSQTSLPIGYLDAIQNGVAYGWTYDADEPNRVLEIHFYVEQTLIGTTIANLSRPDVEAAGYAGNHGFSFTIPESYRDSSSHLLKAFAIDKEGKGNPILFTPKNFKLSPTLPVGYLDGFMGNSVYGWAFDSFDATRAVQIHFYIDGKIAGSTVANQIRPDVDAAGFTGNHGYTWEIPAQYRDNQTHTITAYAIDAEGRGNPQLYTSKIFRLN
jgi:hypothetical protein